MNFPTLSPTLLFTVYSTVPPSWEISDPPLPDTPKTWHQLHTFCQANHHHPSPAILSVLCIYSHPHSTSPQFSPLCSVGHFNTLLSFKPHSSHSSSPRWRLVTHLHHSTPGFFITFHIHTSQSHVNYDLRPSWCSPHIQLSPWHAAPFLHCHLLCYHRSFQPHSLWHSVLKFIARSLSLH